MPDEEGRTKLTKLCAGGLDVSEQLLGQIVSRTKGATPAFIKELMRRCAQFQIEFSPGNVLTEPRCGWGNRRDAIYGRLPESPFAQRRWC